MINQRHETDEVNEDETDRQNEADDITIQHNDDRQPEDSVLEPTIHDEQRANLTKGDNPAMKDDEIQPNIRNENIESYVGPKTEKPTNNEILRFEVDKTIKDGQINDQTEVNLHKIQNMVLILFITSTDCDTISK